MCIDGFFMRSKDADENQNPAELATDPKLPLSVQDCDRKEVHCLIRILTNSLGLFFCVQWKRGGCIRCSEAVTRQDTDSMEITDPQKIPPCVQGVMANDQRGITGFMCGCCKPMFHHAKMKENEHILKHYASLCGICGKKNTRADTPKQKNSHSPCAGVLEDNLRRYGAYGDRCHRACYDLARKQEPLRVANTALQLKVGSVDTGRDKTEGISLAEEQALSFFCSCKKAQNISSFETKSYKSVGGGRTLTVHLVRKSTGCSKSTKHRNNRAVVDVVNTITKNNDHTTNTELISDTAMHTVEGKQAGLSLQPEPVSLEKIQCSIRGSHSTTEKIATELRKVKVKYDITLRELASRRKKRRLKMEFSKDQVVHPECGTNAEQTVFTKRSVDMCDIAAQRHSMLMKSDSFVELPDIKLGGKDALYWTLAVCVCVCVCVCACLI